MNRLLLFVILLTMVGFAACHKSEVTHVTSGAAYFPLRLGSSITYHVDSVVYDDYFHTIDTTSFDLKEVIQDTLRDNLNNLVYKVYRYIRSNAQSAWTFANVWQQQISATKAERIEGNQRFIKLAFPCTPTMQWNGNVYIDVDTVYQVRGATIDTYKDWPLFTYTSIDQPLMRNGFTFDSTLTVVQADIDNAVERRYSVEQYARNIGLVYKKMMILDTQCSQYPNGLADCLTLPWEVKAEKGYILTLTLIDHQ